MEFNRLLFELREELDRRGVSVNKLLDSLTLLLPSKLKIEYETLLQRMLAKIHKFKETNQIVLRLGSLLSFMDYHLLKHLIQMFGNDKLKSDMLSCEKDIDVFMKNTTVAEVINHWPGRRLHSTDFKKLWMKIGDNMQTYTLQKLNELRRKHSCHLQLSVILSGIVDIAPASSFFVAWAVPTWAIDEVTKAIRHVDPTFYESEHITMVILDDKLVYLSNSTQKVCET